MPWGGMDMEIAHLPRSIANQSLDVTFHRIGIVGDNSHALEAVAPIVHLCHSQEIAVSEDDQQWLTLCHSLDPFCQVQGVVWNVNESLRGRGQGNPKGCAGLQALDSVRKASTCRIPVP